MSPATAAARTPLAELHARFSAALPAVKVRAQAAFRRVRCPHDRDDRVADAVLAAWRGFLRRVTEGVPADPDRLADDAVTAARRKARRLTPA
jgi:DNA-directed RNA polymerase specialized sigma24 family protein